MKKITYNNKQYILNDPQYSVEETVTDTDMNEIKEVVNFNADETLEENIKIKEQLEQTKDALINITTEKSDSITVKDSSNLSAKIGVFGTSTQETRSGKNIVDINSEDVYTPNSTSLNVEGDVATVTSNNNAVTSYIAIPIKLKANTNYTFSGIAKVVSNSITDAFESYIKVRQNNNSGNWVSSATATIKNSSIGSNQNLNFTFNSIEYTEAWLWLYIKTTQVTGIISIDFSNLQIEEGTTATEYEQYGASPSPEYPSEIENVGGNVDVIVTNENLILNGYSTPKTDTDFWDAVSSKFTPLENGWGKYLFNNTGASTVYLNSFIKIDKFKNIIKPDTQYKLLVEFKNVQMTDTENKDYFQISGGTSLEFFKTYLIYKTNDIKNNLKFSTNIISKSNINDYKYVFRSFAAINPGNSVSLEVRIALLESDSTQTEIVISNQEVDFPLQEGQKLYKKDYPADDGIHHVRKQIVLDGTENILLEESTLINVKRFYIRDIGEYANNNYQGICSHFNYIGNYSLDEEHIYVTTKGYVYIFAKFNSVDELKEYLAQQKANGTPVIVEYELAEEEIEPYTPEQQEAYNKLQNVLSYKPVTNVFTDKALLVFKYIADTKTYIDNKYNNLAQQLLNL